MVQEGIYALTINLRIKRGYTGILVGQCKEFPAIIVQAKTLFEIKKEIFDAFEGYFKAFPEKIQTALEKKYLILIENQEQKENMDKKIGSQEYGMVKNQEQLQKLPEQQIGLTEQQIGNEWQETKFENFITVQH
jgi:predicted RNase H-like HicB family nuclease